MGARFDGGNINNINKENANCGQSGFGLDQEAARHDRELDSMKPGASTLSGCPDERDSTARKVASAVETISTKGIGSSPRPQTAAAKASSSPRCPLSCRKRERNVCLRP